MAKPKEKISGVEITIDLIEPLIVNTSMEGTRMHCEFRIPGTEEIIHSEGSVKRDRGGAGRVKSMVKRQMANNARRMASRMVRSAIGGGMIGRTASMTMNTASREALKKTSYTKGNKDDAVVAAFIKVKDFFHYDPETETWTKAPEPPPPREKSPFEQQIEQAKIENGYDQEIFARILCELANSDGHVSKEEEEFFNDVIPPKYLPIESLMKKDPVNRIECEEVSEPVKATIYQFAWAIALVDFDLDPIEEELLMEYSELFQFGEDQRDELIRNAKYHVLEGVIDDDTSRDELYEYADRIHLDHFEAERCRARMKKRLG